jgi:hypothetical protein
LLFSDVDIEAQFSINQSRADEITMREDYGSLPMNMHDDGFGEIGFDTPDLVRDGLNPAIDVNLLRLDFFNLTLKFINIHLILGRFILRHDPGNGH